MIAARIELMVLNHTESDKRNVVEIDEAAAAQFGFIGFDEVGELRVPATPGHQAAVNVAATLLLGEGPSLMWIESIVFEDHFVGGLDRGVAFGVGCHAKFLG